MQFILNFLDNFQHNKPLLWKTLKTSQRFAFVGNSKVEHIVLNLEDTVDSISDDFQIQDKEVEAGKWLKKWFTLQCFFVFKFYAARNIDQWHDDNLFISILPGVSAIKRWSAKAGHLEPDDVIISADVDEVLISWQSQHQS